MKPLVSRSLFALCLCCLVVAITLPGCKRKGDEAKQEQAGQPSDANLDARKVKMKDISAICGGIHKVLKSRKLDNVESDAKKLQGIMVEVAKIPPPVDAQKYAFYAADFQKRADVLATAAATGSIDQTRPKFNDLAQTCGVCHYTCKYPQD